MRAEFALWERKLDDGRVVLSGPLFGGLEVAIWPARERKHEMSPTHSLVISERRQPKKEAAAQHEEVPSWGDL